jgi:hypothetical protein
MIRFNLSIRDLFIIFIIFLCYCIFVFYNTQNIIEKFSDLYECSFKSNTTIIADTLVKTPTTIKLNNVTKLKVGDILHKIADIIDENTRITHIDTPNKTITINKPLLITTNMAKVRITFDTGCEDMASFCSKQDRTKCIKEAGKCKWDYSIGKCKTLCKNYDISKCDKDPVCKWDATVSPQTCKDKCVSFTSEMVCNKDPVCKWDATGKTCTDINKDSLDFEQCYDITDDSECKTAKHCNWVNNNCETNCGSYNYESCTSSKTDNKCKWDNNKNLCEFNCSKHTSDVDCNLSNTCRWNINNSENNECEKKSGFNCMEFNNDEWLCKDQSSLCDWDSDTKKCSDKKCDKMTNVTECKKFDKCKWESDTKKCSLKDGRQTSDDPDYFEEQKSNFKIHKIFCDRLKRLDKPNKNNIIFKRFTKDFINNKKKHVKILEAKIKQIHTRQHEIDVYNYNLNKIREHDQASKQVDAIKKGIENIKNKNKIKINLE